MGIPTDFNVAVASKEPIVVRLDVSEKTMGLAAFTAIVAGMVIIKIKRGR